MNTDIIPERFLENCWYVAAWDHELIDARLRPARSDHRAVAPRQHGNGIVADAPLAHFRRTLGKLIDAERGARQPVAA